MQVIAAPPPSRGERLALARSGVVAFLLIATGTLLGWACLATPLVTSLVPHGRPSPAQIAVGIAGLTFALVLPAGFLVLGVVKAAGTLDLVTSRRPRRALPRLAGALDGDLLGAADVVLPDGRRIHELLVGPFGVVVVGDLPPLSMTRHVGRRWEVRDGRGNWLPVEPPVERAARDAERVRRWLASADHDFVARVYAVIVTDDPGIERTSSCAVVASDALPRWLASLPPQRGLTPARRETLVRLIRDLTARR